MNLCPGYYSLFITEAFEKAKAIERKDTLKRNDKNQMNMLPNISNILYHLMMVMTKNPHLKRIFLKAL